MSEKIYARFLSPVTMPDASKTVIKVNGKPFQYVDLDENTAKSVLEQASLYLFSDSYTYEYEYDDDPRPTVSRGVKNYEIKNLISISSTTYCSDEPRADMVVLNGQFIGVIAYVKNKGGNGFDNYDTSGYTFFTTDGLILGNRINLYSYSGETSSKCYEDVYSLIKK